MSISANKSTAGHAWLWALLPLLLAATLATPLLDVDAFNGDEPASLLARRPNSAITGPHGRIEASLELTLTNSDPLRAYGWSHLALHLGTRCRLERGRHPGPVPSLLAC